MLKEMSELTIANAFTILIFLPPVFNREGVEHLMLENIGASVRRSSGRRSGNDVVATIFIPIFFYFFFFPVFFTPVFFSLSRPFLIEGVLGSKNLFSESCLERPKT